ncbi:MAG: hypothetical protein Kow0077_16700 [Anaerolineae bacterium]
MSQVYHGFRPIAEIDAPEARSLKTEAAVQSVGAPVGRGHADFDILCTHFGAKLDQPLNERSSDSLAAPAWIDNQIADLRTAQPARDSSEADHVSVGGLGDQCLPAVTVRRFYCAPYQPGDPALIVLWQAIAVELGCIFQPGRPNRPGGFSG